MTVPRFERLPLFERRPAITILLALAAGIAFGTTSQDPTVLLPIALAGLVIVLCIAVLFRKHPLFLLLSTLSASALCGIALITASMTKDEGSLLSQFGKVSDEEVALVGQIDDVREAGTLYLRLRCDSIVTGSDRHALDDEAAGIFLTVSDGSTTLRLKRGARVRVFGELAAFAPQRNPYAFDYDEYLRRSENINAVMYCDPSYDVSVLGHAEPTLYDRMLDLFSQLRTDAKDAISGTVADTLVRGFILAMVLGERKALPDDIWEDFQQAGLSHILVVSGFNLGIVAWALYLVLRLIRLGRREVRIALVMAATLFYGALVGPQPSVIRAVIVVELILISRLFERRSDLTNVTAGAALVDLTLAPDNLFNVSFQLSYGAVFALTLIAPALDRYCFPDREQRRTWYMICLKGAIGTAAVLLGTLPVVLFHFHQVSVISILTNLLTIPLASLATILSVLLIPLATISSALASLYVDAVSTIIYLMRAIASIAKDLPFAVIRLPHPSAVFIALYVLSLFYIIRPASLRPAAARGLVVMVLALSIASIGFGLRSSYIKEKMLSIIFFDVGQGDATLIATPHGKYYMIDAGGITRSGKSISERAVLPFLEAEQIAHIDAAFATHLHLDHYGGLPHLVQERSVDTIYSCGGRTTASHARILDSVVVSKQLPVRHLESGNIITLDDEVTAYILHPLTVSSGPPPNERSLVMKIVYRNTSVLLLADISSETEELLVSRYGTFLESDIVKVAHHGSRTSSSDRFIAQADPQYAVFSCGRRNRHGHPHPEIVARWQTGKANIVRTDVDGAIVFRTDGQAIEQVAWR